MPQGRAAERFCEMPYSGGHATESCAAESTSVRSNILGAVLQGHAAEWLCERQFSAIFWGLLQGRAAEWLCERHFFPGPCRKAVPQSCSVRGSFLGAVLQGHATEYSSAKKKSGDSAAGPCRMRKTIFWGPCHKAVLQSGSVRSNFWGRAAEWLK